MKMSHLISFHQIKLSDQLRSVMASSNSVHYSCCKVLNLLNFLQVGAGGTGIYNVTTVIFETTVALTTFLNVSLLIGPRTIES